MSINKKSWTRRAAILSAAVATSVMVGGAALAAVTVFGSGTLEGNAYEVHELEVSDGKISDIYPGAVLDVSFKVKNDNAFPVTVETVALDGNTLDAVKGSCVGESGAGLKLFDTNLPLIGGARYDLKPSEKVTLAPGQKATVTIADAMQYDKFRTKAEGCTLSIKFKVSGTQSAS